MLREGFKGGGRGGFKEVMTKTGMRETLYQSSSVLAQY